MKCRYKYAKEFSRVMLAVNLHYQQSKWSSIVKWYNNAMIWLHGNAHTVNREGWRNGLVPGLLAPDSRALLFCTHYFVLITNLGLGNTDILATNWSRAMKHRCVWGGASNFAKSTSRKLGDLSCSCRGSCIEKTSHHAVLVYLLVCLYVGIYTFRGHALMWGSTATVAM